MLSMKIINVAIFKPIRIICRNIFVVYLLLLLLLSGCTAKEKPLFDANYKAKQAQFTASSINYVICKDCIQYTRIHDVQDH